MQPNDVPDATINVFTAVSAMATLSEQTAVSKSTIKSIIVPVAITHLHFPTFVLREEIMPEIMHAANRIIFITIFVLSGAIDSL